MINYLPNLLTIFRFFLVYPIVICIFEAQFVLAIGFFILAGISDFLDGYYARKLEAISEFGMIADPIADKTLVIGTLISLAIVGKIDLWLAYIILGRDMIAIVGFILSSVLLSPYKVKTHFSGKAYTAFLLIFLGVTILSSAEIFNNSILNLSIIFLLIVSIFLSLLDYLRDPGMKLMRKNFLIMKQQSLDLEFQNYIEMQDMQSCSFFEEIYERVNNFLSSDELSLCIFWKRRFSKIFFLFRLA